MSEFINDQTARIAGVIKIESMIVHSVKKISFGMLTAGLEPVENSDGK